MAGGSAKTHNWKLPISCTSYHNIRIYNIHTYCLCHGTLFVQPVYRLALVVCELRCLYVVTTIWRDCIMRALHARLFVACMLSRGEDPHSCPSHKIPSSVWLWYGTWVQPTDEESNVRHPLENQYSARTEANQVSERQPTDEERKVIRDYIQKSEAPVTMVDLFKHLGHTIRTVAKVLCRSWRRKGLSGNLRAVEQRQTSGNGLTRVHISTTLDPELYVCMLYAFHLSCTVYIT